MKLLFTATVALTLLAGAAQAATVGFEGLTGTGSNSFNGLGINTTYQGYTWSAANSAQTPALWGAAQGPLGGLSAHSGTGFAWTFNGGQSMFIDFGASTNVVDVYVAGQFAGNDATSVQLFGYNASNVLVSQTGVTSLAVGQWSQVTANLNGIFRLEFRSNAPTRWFGIDDLQVTAGTTVPEPSSLALVALAGLSLVAGRKHANRRARG